MKPICLLKKAAQTALQKTDCLRLKEERKTNCSQTEKLQRYPLTTNQSINHRERWLTRQKYNKIKIQTKTKRQSAIIHHSKRTSSKKTPIIIIL